MVFSEEISRSQGRKILLGTTLKIFCNRNIVENKWIISWQSVQLLSEIRTTTFPMAFLDFSFARAKLASPREKTSLTNGFI